MAFTPTARSYAAFRAGFFAGVRCEHPFPPADVRTIKERAMWNAGYANGLSQPQTGSLRAACRAGYRAWTRQDVCGE